MRYAGRRAGARKAPSRLPRAAIGIAALAAVGALAALGHVPLLLAGWYAAASLAAYMAYYSDKVSAGRGWRRTPENTLHLFGLLGGWPGALVAQQQFRHKTVKQPFQLVFWLSVAGNLAGVAWVLHRLG